MTALLLQAEILLSVPVTVEAADGKTAERSRLVMRRPKVRHAKQLAALIGRDLVDVLAREGETADTLEGLALVKEILTRLLEGDRLDGLTALIADLCGEQQQVIDDVDLVDLISVGRAFMDFFPQLRSATSGLSRAISPSSAA